LHRFGWHLSLFTIAILIERRLTGYIKGIGHVS
jgi:hypothetical protein